jgi:hypothetical protein
MGLSGLPWRGQFLVEEALRKLSLEEVDVMAKESCLGLIALKRLNVL